MSGSVGLTPVSTVGAIYFSLSSVSPPITHFPLLIKDFKRLQILHNTLTGLLKNRVWVSIVILVSIASTYLQCIGNSEFWPFQHYEKVLSGKKESGKPKQNRNK